MAADEKKRNIKTQTAEHDGHKWRQTLEDGQVIYEEDLGEIKPLKPNTPPATAEPATAAAEPASTTTEPVKPAQPEEKKGLSAKVKRGLAIGGGVIGGLAAYALGVRKGRTDGEAEGYSEGYADGKASAETSDVSETWEAQE